VCDELFRQATGWLGWSAHDALTTPIPMIHLAMEGRMDCVKKTTPEFAQAEQQRQAERPDPETLQDQIKTSLGGLARASKTRHARRKRENGTDQP